MKKDDVDQSKDKPTMNPEPDQWPAMTPQPAHQTYAVKRGESLRDIAQKFYGAEEQYVRIMNANDEMLEDPDDIYPGLELMIPTVKPPYESANAPAGSQGATEPGDRPPEVKRD